MTLEFNLFKLNLCDQFLALVDFLEKMKRKYSKLTTLSIQILQYEFLGPIPLEEWGPPMEKLVFLILSREKEKFNVLFVGDCEKTEDKSFFVQHSSYKCWIDNSGSEKSLHLAILPLFESSAEYRQNITNKIISNYKPVCNLAILSEKKPDYVVRKSENISRDSEKVLCLCCGAEMKPEQILEKSTLFRCASCGLSDTRIT